MKKITQVILLVSLILFAIPKMSFAEGLELGLYYPYDYNVTSQDDNLRLDFDEGSTGVVMQFISPFYLGMGISFYQKNFKDLSTDYKYKINNYFFDLIYTFPTPDFFKIAAGVGVGQTELTCDNQECEDFYKAQSMNDFESVRSNSTQFFINLGFKVGIIYKLNFGYSTVSAGKLELRDEDSRATLFEINGDANVFLVGVSVEFI